MLLGYTALNVIAAWLVGSDSWFRYGELFRYFFRLVGKMAPLEYIRGADSGRTWSVRARKPFVGLLQAPQSTSACCCS